MPKRELTLRFITSYSVPLTDGSTVASALVTEVIFSGMGPLYAPVGSTEPVTSVESIEQDFEVVKTVAGMVMLAVGAGILLVLGASAFGALIANEAVKATFFGTVILLTEIE
ncbi:hypothetical protein ACTQ45_06700 [Fundicoccus sp. Sow4_D5]|uniref:hypothetical protein n=1 Tax=Fundicoccus sp. Sow4_D5 TaxID=3438782 RepID=UPI003F921421